MGRQGGDVAVTRVTHITIHCSATKPSQPVDAQIIDRWHRNQGFLKIGYHFVIKRDGELQTGRALTEPGAHVSGHNAGNIGICLAGGLNEKTGKAEDNYTGDQWITLVALLKDLRTQYPDAEILGHRDFPNVKKDCPCFDVKKWLKKVGI